MRRATRGLAEVSVIGSARRLSEGRSAKGLAEGLVRGLTRGLVEGSVIGSARRLVEGSMEKSVKGQSVRCR